MKKAISLVMAMAFSYILFAQQTTQHNANEIRTQPLRAVNDMGLKGLEVSYEFGASHMQAFTELLPNGKSELFTLLSIPGFSHLQVPGQAALPAHIDLIAVPKGATYSLNIESTSFTTQKNMNIYPARQPARDTEGAPEPGFEYDEQYYQQNQYFPQNPVSIVEEVEIRGMTFLLVQIYPVQFNPAKKQIRKYGEIKYEVSFSGSEAFLDYENHSKTFINNLAATPLNGSSILKGAKKSNSAKSVMQSSHLPINYIIITKNTYSDAADSLAHWKRQMGYGVKVITANTWTAADVKSEIHDHYANLNPKPDYFVILGDHPDVPSETFTAPDGNGTYGTDLYYACMGGGNDYVPEMAYGRISVSSAAQAMAVVQKIITYERNPISDTSFYKNGLNCAQFQDDNTDGFADRRFTHTSEDVRDYMMGQAYHIDRIYYTGNSVYPLKYNASYYSNGQNIPSDLLKTNGFAWTGGATNIKDAINSGKFYVLHRDHGYAGGSGWAHPYFTTSSINTLSNGNKLPVIFSINCHTGEFTLNNCFAEKFLRHSNGGAVGVFAASYYSYSGFNDGLSIGFFDGIWSNPGLVPQFGSGGLSNPNTTSHTDIENMGWVMNHGKLRMTQTWGGGNSGRQYTYRLFHYFGDPAMRMWTKEPQVITASHDTVINCSDTAFAITNCSDSLATATLMFGNQLLAVGQIVNHNGSIQIPSVIGQVLTLTITARDAKPYMAQIHVNASGGMSLNAYVENNVCYNDSIGSIQLIPSCGNPPYEIMWADSSNALVRTNLAGGDYIVTVTDSTSASITDTIHVWSPAAPLSSSPIVQDAQCYFQSSGRVDLNLTGGAAPYNYQWSNGSTSSNALNLAAGTISVMVSDSVGCTFSQNFTIDQPTPLDLTATSTDDTANNCTGTGTAIVNGGIPPYQYSWNDPNNQNTAVASGLCKGLYKVTVRDSNECVQYRTIIISNTVGMEETEEDDFQIFPNPFEDKLRIKLQKATTGNLIINVFDASGKLVLNKDFTSTQSGELILDLSDLSTGYYTISIQNNDKVLLTSKRILKSK
jgi:hypothetical protein